MEWVQVASGAAELYAEEVQQIPTLTPHGTQQLLADLEYFCNVLAALGVALPSTLTTWQVLPSMQQRQLFMMGCACIHHNRHLCPQKQLWPQPSPMMACLHTLSNRDGDWAGNV